LRANVARLKAYKPRVVVVKGKKSKKDTTVIPSQLKAKHILPIKKTKPRSSSRLITEDDKKKHAFLTLRHKRAQLKYGPKRAKKAAEKAASESLTKKE